MTGWHRPDVETAALDYLTRAIGDPAGARQIVDGLLARGRVAGRVAGLREAAALIDVEDGCECGTCTARADAARIRDRADLLTGAGS